MAEFHETMMGRKFYEYDVVLLNENLERIAKAIERIAAALEKR